MNSSPSERRILVIRGGAIGDFLLVLPALRLLRENLPRCQIEVMGYAGIAELAVKAGMAETTRSLGDARLARLFARGAEVDADLAAYFQSFQLVISYLFDPDGLFKDNLLRHGVKTLIDQPTRLAEGAGHASLQLAQPLQKLAIFAEEPQWRAPFHPAVSADSLRHIAIHLGSGSPRKNWPQAHWHRLAQDLRQRQPGLTVTFITGEAEAERQQHAPSGFPTWHGLPLPELAERLRHCQLFLGHDSGISHLAAAWGLPCVLLFGPTDPSVWAPPQPGVQILRAPAGDLSLLPYEAVYDTVRAHLT